MEKFTLFELHLDEVSFTASAYGAEDDEETEDGAAETPGGGTAGRGRRLLLVLLALLVLVAIARSLSGDDELEDLADLDATE